MSAARGLVRDSLVYGLGNVAARLVAFLSLPLYTRVFEPEDYGRLSVVVAVLGLVSPLLALGSDTAYVRFWFAASDDEGRRAVSTTWLATLAVWSLLAVLATLPATPALARALTGDSADALPLALALLSAPVALLNRMCAQTLRIRFLPVPFTVLTLSTTAATVLVGLALAVQYGVAGAVAGLLVGELLLLPAHLWYARPVLGRVFDKALLLRMLRFGVPLVPTSVAYWVFLSSDRLMLARLSSLREVAVYSVAAAVAALLGLLQVALGQAFVPRVTAMHEQDDRAARQLTADVLRPVLALGAVVTVCFVLLAHEIIAVLAAPEYASAADLVWVLGLGQLAFLLMPVVGIGMTLTGRTGWLALHSAAAALLNIGLNVLLIPSEGARGAAVATLVAYAYLTLALLLTCQRLWRVPYAGRSTTATAVASGGLVFGASWAADVPGAAGLAARAGWLAGTVGLLVLTGALPWRRLAGLVARRTSPGASG